MSRTLMKKLERPWRAGKW